MIWTATILKHNDDGLTMDVEFHRSGYDNIVVGMLLPPLGADLQTHIAKYAPITTWDWIDQMSIQRDTPTIGTVIQAPQPIVQPAAILQESISPTSETIFEI